MQDVTEEVMLRLARALHPRRAHENLCLAGGVALNCVANGRILREGPFENIWIQPAAGDAGGALGAAYAAWHRVDERPRQGVPVARTQCAAATSGRFSATKRSSGTSMISAPRTSDWTRPPGVPRRRELATEKVVGWLQGPMEFGPRALGGRSILGDPRSRKCSQ